MPDAQMPKITQSAEVSVVEPISAELRAEEAKIDTFWETHRTTIVASLIGLAALGALIKLWCL